MIKSKVKEIKSGKLTAVQNVMNFSKKIATPRTKNLNIFLNLNENAIDQAKKIDKRIKEGKEVGNLAGICFAVKANISVKGMETNCASLVLEGYVSGYNASVITKLLEEDAIILGMLNLDEFACGVSGETSAFGPTKNPKNPALVPGGSSSGPAAAIAEELADFTLGSDTGGSIRNPASHCGVVGLKPTYGAVSRYGLLDLSMSLDCIGPMTNSVKDARLIFNIIKGQDNFDQSSMDSPKILKEHKGVIGLVNVDKFCDEKIQKLIEDKVEKIAKEKNFKIKKIDLPLDIMLETYFITVYVEFFSATRKFDGRRFGKKIEKFAGPEVQRRIIGGSEITKAEHDGRFYNEASKAQNYIQEKFDKIFSEVDAIILPTVPKLAHKIGEKLSVKDLYNYDIFTIPSSIAKIPTISIPAGQIDGKEIGMQIATPKFQEELMFKLAEDFQ